MKIKKFLAKKMLEKTGKVCKDEKRNNWNKKNNEDKDEY